MTMKDDSKSKTAVSFEDTVWDGCVIHDGKSIEVNAAWKGGRKQVVFFIGAALAWRAAQYACVQVIGLRGSFL